MYIVSTEQMQAAEQAADAAGLSYEQMMENAGRAVAETIETAFDLTGLRILILVGPGNNGGDGLVVARYLAQSGATISVYVWKRDTDGDKNWGLLDGTGVERVMAEDEGSQERLAQLLDEAAIIVDALLGTGVSRPISGTLAELLEDAKAAVEDRQSIQNWDDKLVEPARPYHTHGLGPVVVALDVPSGLNSDTGEVDPYTLPADLTVTLAAVKRGHVLGSAPDVVGQLVVGDIGIGPEHYPEETLLEMVTAAEVASLLPARPATAHKGTFGTALITAGSIYYTGAAILSGQAALRVGTGLVTLTPPQSIHPIVASSISEATYLPLPDQDGFLAPAAVEVLQEKFERASALLVGPGLGNFDSTAGFVTALLELKEQLPPLVLDADGLNILAGLSNWWMRLPPESILTPHPGEMARLMDTTTTEVQANRLEMAADMAAKWSQIVVLKGAHTVVAAPNGRTMVLPFANPGLAKAGSGDVLAGAIVGFRAQGLAPFDAAVAGAYVHGLAGEIARDDLGATSVVAGDLVACLPLAGREIAGQQ